jgi:hypothetical protein
LAVGDYRYCRWQLLASPGPGPVCMRTRRGRSRAPPARLRGGHWASFKPALAQLSVTRTRWWIAGEIASLISIESCVRSNAMADQKGVLAALLGFLADIWFLFKVWLSGETQETAAEASAAAKKRRRKKKPAAAGAAATAAGAPQEQQQEDEASGSGSGSDGEAEAVALAAAPLASLGGARRGFVGLSTDAPDPGCGAGGWEAVGAAPAGGSRGRGAPLRLGAAAGPRARPAGKAGGAAAPKGPLQTCARPECGAVGAVGFKKCGRCRTVVYCTPACLASDWHRHQPQCQAAVEAAAALKKK